MYTIDPTTQDLLTKRIRTITEDVSLPYFEMHVFQHYDRLFSYTDKPANCQKKNKLYFYSCTKPLTVVCALQLMECGKLSLDDTLVTYLPSFEKAFFINPLGERQLVGSEITLRHLLTMTAGFGYDFEIAPLKTLFATQKNPTTTEIIDKLAEHPLLFRPGTQFCYSLCLDVMARVIEVVSQQRFSEYMQQHVFTPLEMENCGFREDNLDEMLPQHIVKDGKITPYFLRNDLVRSNGFDSGGAGVIGTIDDYGKFAVTLANGGVAANGYRLLKPESVLAMRTPHIQSLKIENNFTCVQGNDYSYGLGVRTRTVPTSYGLPVGEFGWDGAAGSYLLIDPQKQLSITMGMHLLEWPHLFSGKHLDLVEQVYRVLGI